MKLLKSKIEIEKNFYEKFNNLTQRLHEKVENNHSCADRCLALFQILSFIHFQRKDDLEKIIEMVEQEKTRKYTSDDNSFQGTAISKGLSEARGKALIDILTHLKEAKEEI